MKNPDKMSEQELRREVRELREGKCRLNCRSVKEGFYAGFAYALKVGDEPHNDCVCVYDTPDQAYKDWEHERP